MLRKTASFSFLSLFLYLQLSLDRAGHHTTDKVTLQAQEDDQRDDHGNERTGRQQMPVLTAGTDDVRQRLGDDHLLAAAQNDKGDQIVIPDPQELENAE